MPCSPSTPVEWKNLTALKFSSAMNISVQVGEKQGPPVSVPLSRKLLDSSSRQMLRAVIVSALLATASAFAPTALPSTRAVSRTSEFSLVPDILGVGRDKESHLKRIPSARASGTPCCAGVGLVVSNWVSFQESKHGLCVLVYWLLRVTCGGTSHFAKFRLDVWTIEIWRLASAVMCLKSESSDQIRRAIYVQGGM